MVISINIGGHRPSNECNAQEGPSRQHVELPYT